MIGEKKKQFSGLWWFVPSALAAGTVNGLLGAGGGVIMLYLVKAVLTGKEQGEGAQKDVFASVVAIMLPVSVISALSYRANGNLDMERMSTLILPALAGGMIGAYLTDKLPSRVIRGIFALLVIVSGIRMIL